VAIVTGAGSGIGRATAMRLAVEGARVACVDRAGDPAEETAKAITGAGGQAVALVVDVTEPAACERMVRVVVERWRTVTTLVNSAGVRAEGSATTAPEEWRRVLGVNLDGTYFASRAALPALAASGNATVTNLASIYGLVGGSLSPAYAASKGAVANLTRQMALQWAPAVRVNAVCPGVIETPMTEEPRRDPTWREWQLERHPLRRFGKPEEVAAAIVWLASEEASFVTGVTLPIDGGYTAA
jgi:NAD(P)-dependent dehydrogenase (short-subunit alcohol dehydrogenase family)